MLNRHSLNLGAINVDINAEDRQLVLEAQKAYQDSLKKNNLPQLTPEEQKANERFASVYLSGLKAGMEARLKDIDALISASEKLFDQARQKYERQILELKGLELKLKKKDIELKEKDIALEFVKDTVKIAKDTCISSLEAAADITCDVASGELELSFDAIGTRIIEEGSKIVAKQKAQIISMVVENATLLAYQSGSDASVEFMGKVGGLVSDVVSVGCSKQAKQIMAKGKEYAKAALAPTGAATAEYTKEKIGIDVMTIGKKGGSGSGVKGLDFEDIYEKALGANGIRMIDGIPYFENPASPDLNTLQNNLGMGGKLGLIDKEYLDAFYKKTKISLLDLPENELLQLGIDTQVLDLLNKGKVKQAVLQVVANNQGYKKAVELFKKQTGLAVDTLSRNALSNLGITDDMLAKLRKGDATGALKVFIKTKGSKYKDNLIKKGMDDFKKYSGIDLKKVQNEKLKELGVDDKVLDAIAAGDSKKAAKQVIYNKGKDYRNKAIKAGLEKLEAMTDIKLTDIPAKDLEKYGLDSKFLDAVMIGDFEGSIKGLMKTTLSKLANEYDIDPKIVNQLAKGNYAKAATALVEAEFLDFADDYGIDRKVLKDLKGGNIKKAAFSIAKNKLYDLTSPYGIDAELTQKIQKGDYVGAGVHVGKGLVTASTGITSETMSELSKGNIKEGAKGIATDVAIKQLEESTGIDTDFPEGSVLGKLRDGKYKNAEALYKDIANEQTAKDLAEVGAKEGLSVVGKTPVGAVIATGAIVATSFYEGFCSNSKDLVGLSLVRDAEKMNAKIRAKARNSGKIIDKEQKELVQKIDQKSYEVDATEQELLARLNSNNVTQIEKTQWVFMMTWFQKSIYQLSILSKTYPYMPKDELITLFFNKLGNDTLFALKIYTTADILSIFMRGFALYIRDDLKHEPLPAPSIPSDLKEHLRTAYNLNEKNFCKNMSRLEVKRFLSDFEDTREGRFAPVSTSTTTKDFFQRVDSKLQDAFAEAKQRFNSKYFGPMGKNAFVSFTLRPDGNQKNILSDYDKTLLGDPALRDKKLLAKQQKIRSFFPQTANKMMMGQAPSTASNISRAIILTGILGLSYYFLNKKNILTLNKKKDI